MIPGTNGCSVDWSNPCMRFAALQTAYYSLLTGARETEIRTRTLDAEEMVRFQSADIEKLRIEMQQAQSECARASGQPDPGRRFAITAGNHSDIPRIPSARWVP